MCVNSGRNDRKGAGAGTHHGRWSQELVKGKERDERAAWSCFSSERTGQAKGSVLGASAAIEQGCRCRYLTDCAGGYAWPVFRVQFTVQQSKLHSVEERGTSWMH